MGARRRGKKTYKVFAKVSDLFWKVTFPTNYHQKAAGWYGNDTTWRMVTDLNKIALYGKPDGTVSDKPQRNLYSL
ncbi:MAG: hypothetical protein U5L09_08940 [Bacteroidales bacterium]|nr:hypothetical protein [Bacteroidales bacterium]